jgi:hypothetical protein
MCKTFPRIKTRLLLKLPCGMDARPLSVSGHVLLRVRVRVTRKASVVRQGRPSQDYWRLCLFVEVWLSFRLRIACVPTCMFYTVWICLRLQIACARTYIWVRVQLCFGLQSGCTRTYSFARVWLCFGLHAEWCNAYLHVLLRRDKRYCFSQ